MFFKCELNLDFKNYISNLIPNAALVRKTATGYFSKIVPPLHNKSTPVHKQRHVRSANRDKSVYSTRHPSFAKTVLFARSSVQRLNKHSLAYATYYRFPAFVSTNHPQMGSLMWAGCVHVLSLIAGDCGVGGWAR